ncbi:hypothetical protein [Lactobacillus sp. CBA3605] [Lactiplantibacillus mudanjiangensis]|uniref:BspA family leucine-rich repeat surface protein n=1 Tax=Lactiplantibacillus mudanjiangensis TaxID=1296538 RepID=UPI0010140EAA|nr:BspA family leucine-rich repeat surface protein [Lactiplantibacillus mudanjiangensis]VDG30960.1 hypothetical protein [Lactobacillus sp. CBA3605] [Lactiplantibacillus mudanjiangensis]
MIGQTEVKVPNNIWKQYFDITKVKTINFTGKVTANADSSGLFIDMTNLTTINNANLLDMSQVTNMDNMFYRDTALESVDVSKWDVSNVTSMYSTFNDTKSLKALDVSNWNVSKVQNMANLFWGNAALTELDVSKWVTSSVTNMAYVFDGLTNVTTLDVSNWDTSKATTMAYMFYNSGISSLDTSKWVTSSVTNMAGMFGYATKLTTITGIENWNTSKVTNMSYLFSNAHALNNIDLSKWDTTSAKNMAYMFNQTLALTSVDVSNFDTSKVKNMQAMFSNAQALTAIDVSQWHTGSVTNFNNMFSYTKGLTTALNVANWDTTNAVDMSHMFYASEVTALDVSNWQTGNVTDMSYLFGTTSGVTSKLTTLNVANWDTSSVINMAYMFARTTALKALDVTKWNTSNVTNMAYMFSRATQLKALAVDSWDVGNVTNMSYMFFVDSALTSLDLSAWDTHSVTTTSSMFSEDKKLATLKFGNWKTDSLTDISYMFYDMAALTSLDLSGWTTTGNVTNMGFAFSNTGLTALDLANWTTTSVDNNGTTGVTNANDYGLGSLFAGSKALKSLDISNFTISDDLNISKMLSGTTALNALTLGTGARLKNSTGNATLTDLTSDLYYTGNWVKSDEQTTGPTYTSTNLMSAYNGTAPGTYVWQDRVSLADLTTDPTVTLYANPQSEETWSPVEAVTKVIDVYGDDVDKSTLTTTITDSQNNPVDNIQLNSADTYTVTYQYKDQLGVTHSAKTVVTVKANQADLTLNQTTDNLVDGDTLDAETYFKAATNVDGSNVAYNNLTVSFTKDGQTISTPTTVTTGTYVVTYAFTDQQSHPQTATLTLTVADNRVGLVVTDQSKLIAGDTWSPKTAFTSASDTDGTAVTFDKIGVAITKDGQAVSAVDTSKTGTYLVTYSFTDQQGNLQQATSTVIVTDSQAGLKVNKQVTLATGDTWQASDQVNSATDTDGSVVHFDKLTVSITKDGQTVTSIDTSTTGTYLVTYSFTDQQGNLQQATSTVTITNNQAQISVIPETDLTVGDSWTPADNFKGATDVDGTAVTFNQLTVTVSRLARDGQPLTSVDTSQPGRYLVTYSFTDQQGQVQTAGY